MNGTSKHGLRSHMFSVQTKDHCIPRTRSVSVLANDGPNIHSQQALLVTEHAREVDDCVPREAAPVIADA